MKRRSFAVPIDTPQSAPLATEKTGVRLRRRDDESLYSLEGSGDAFINRYHPVYMAQGGEHFVYKIPDNPKFVIKADKGVLFEILREDPNTTHVGRMEDSKALMRANLVLRHDQRTFQTLERIFGKEHALFQKKFLVKVPVNEAILSKVQNQFDPERYLTQIRSSERAWTLVTVQERIDKPADRLSVQSWSLEHPDRFGGLIKDPKTREQYSRVTDALSNGERAAESDVTLDDLSKLIKDRPLFDLLQQAEQDEGLRNVLRDFAEKAVQFAEESGEILDIGGEDNILFYKKDGTWTYKLIDPVYLYRRRILKTAREAIRDSREKGLSSAQDKERGNALIQAMNFTRTINAIVKLTGGTKYFDLLPNDNRKHAFLNTLLPRSPILKSA